MAFGEQRVSTHEPSPELLDEFVLSFQKTFEMLARSREQFERLEAGIPPLFILAIAKLSQQLDEGTYRLATARARNVLGEANQALLDRQVLAPTLSERAFRRHQQMLLDLFDMLADPWYARVLIKEMHLRQEAVVRARRMGGELPVPLADQSPPPASEPNSPGSRSLGEVEALYEAVGKPEKIGAPSRESGFEAVLAKVQHEEEQERLARAAEARARRPSVVLDAASLHQAPRIRSDVDRWFEQAVQSSFE